MRSRATRWLAIGGLFLLGATFPLAAAEVTRDNFLVRTNADLVTLCSVEESDPLYQAAVGFCHGYVVGAHHYHLALTEHSKHKYKPLVCMPDPRPTRAQSIERYVAWSRAHPQYDQELPVEALFKFLIETWPCQQ